MLQRTARPKLTEKRVRTQEPVTVVVRAVF